MRLGVGLSLDWAGVSSGFGGLVWVADENEDFFFVECSRLFSLWDAAAVNERWCFIWLNLNLSS